MWKRMFKSYINPAHMMVIVVYKDRDFKLALDFISKRGSSNRCVRRGLCRPFPVRENEIVERMDR
jgi:hypothetical protein